MSFTSVIYQNELILNDQSSIDEGAAGIVFGKGLDLGRRGPKPYEYGDVADPFPSTLLIAESEFQARIKEMEETGTNISSLIKKRKSPCKNQEQTNYCWFNSPTRCTEIVRMQQGEPQIILSPASGGAQVTNFRNVGGWGRDALEWIVENGLNDVKDWPANAISKQYATAANKAKAMQNRIVEWTELIPRNRQQLISMLLRRIPVACGFNWWGHEVTAVDAVWIDGTVAARFENSWGPSYGDNGLFILQGSKMLPDDAVAPRTAVSVD